MDRCAWGFAVFSSFAGSDMFVWYSEILRFFSAFAGDRFQRCIIYMTLYSTSDEHACQMIARRKAAVWLACLQNTLAI